MNVRGQKWSTRRSFYKGSVYKGQNFPVLKIFGKIREISTEAFLSMGFVGGTRKCANTPIGTGNFIHF